MISTRSLSLRTSIGVVLFGLVVAGCPTNSDVDTSSADGGPLDEAGIGSETGLPVADGSTADSAPPGPACGRLGTLCKEGEKCSGAPDCASKICVSGVCMTAAPADGIKNGDETDVDCGGTKAPACVDGKSCIAKTDCTSGVCAASKCAVPTATDGVQNGNETGVDCGGTSTSAPKCKAGSGCLTNADCDNIKCDTVAKKCLPASNTDKIKNLDETGVDCGGPTAAVPRCAPGQGCVDGTDCDNVLCNVGTLVCDPPTNLDKLKNGTETDADCGGGAPTNAPACPDDKTCAVDGDCSSKVCSTALKCVAGRSCKAAAAVSGITTCGKRETDDGTKVHESCCRSLPLPVTTTVRLDKYEVTAGRMRQFVETVGPNLRAWAKNEIANNTALGLRLKADLITATNVDMTDLLPASATPGEPLNMVQQIGATVMDSREPSMSQGCYNDNGAYGANTYYWDAVTLASHFAGHPARRFTKAQYDEKSMNCGAYWMYAAFCSWDGGRMPTEAEMNEAWGAANYPWGTATFTFPLDSMHQGQYGYEATANYFNNNGFYWYHFPDYGDAKDLAGYIAAPGRFILDKTTQVSANGESWMDLGANVMELTKFRTPQSGNNTFCDFSITNGPGDVPNINVCKDGAVAGVARKTGLPNTVWVGGSWEGHQKFTTNPGSEPFFFKKSYDLPAQTQYGKTGVRCAR